jgi:FAD/FMN-containing dehydrogenase
LHLNITSKEYSPHIQELIESKVYSWVRDYKGSISAEHGLGLMKADKVHYSKSPEMIEWMKKVKRLFDPRGIMNPYKFIR